MSISDKRGPSRPPRMDAGELAEPIAAYGAHLSGLGYTALTIGGCADSARHLAAWLAISGVAVSAVDEHVFERFAQHRCRCGGSRRLDRLSGKYVNRARRFARFLGTLGLVPAAAPEPVAVDPCVAILAKHVRNAAAAQPSLVEKRVTPHVLRHTCAMHTLQATHDVRKVSLWLGHATLQSTEIYLRADPTGKLEALAAMEPLLLRPGRFREPDKVLAMLSDVQSARKYAERRCR